MLTRVEHDALVRSQRWSVEAFDEHGPIRVVRVRASWRGETLAYGQLVDMDHVSRFRFPEAALEEKLLNIQDALVRLAHEDTER